MGVFRAQLRALADREQFMRQITSAVVALMFLAAPAAASDGRHDATAAAEAARALQQQAVQAVGSGKRLDMTTSPASENLRRVLNTKSIDELPPISATDTAWLVDWLGAVRSTTFTLVYFGADPARPLNLAPDKLQQNVTQYEDEITRVMVFSQKLFPRAIATTQVFLDSLPEKERTSKVRLDGRARMVMGYMESIEGALAFVAATDTKPANVRLIAAALRDSAATWTEMAEPDLRKRFSGFVTAARMRTKDRETSEHLRAIESALAAKS